MEKIKATRRGFFAALFAVIAARFAPKPKRLPMSRADFEATLRVYEELLYRKLDEQPWLHLEDMQMGTGYIRLIPADPALDPDYPTGIIFQQEMRLAELKRRYPDSTA